MFKNINIVKPTISFYQKSGTYFAERLLFFLYLIILAGFFFLDTSQQRLFLYLAMPTGLYYLLREKPWEIFDKKPLVVSVGLFILFSSLSVLWSDGMSIERAFQKGKLLVFIPLGVLPFAALLKKYPEHWHRLTTGFVVSALITSILLLITNPGIIQAALERGARLEGWGRAHNSVQCGLLYGLAFLAVLFPAGSAHPLLKNRYFRFLAACMLLLTVLLTGARGPLLALAVTSIVVFIAKGRLKQSLAIALLVSFCATIFFLSPYDLGRIKERGDSTRFGIWAQSVEKIEEAPLLGHGIGAKFYYSVFSEVGQSTVISSHPHSVYLSTLVNFGVIGFLLFISVLSLLFYYSFFLLRSGYDNMVFAFPLMGALLGIVDFGGYFINLSTEWMVFWLPIAVCLAIRR